MNSLEGETEAALDTSLFKEIARKSLVDALNAVNGAKTLVLDATLAGPLGLVTEVALLKHHGVDKMFWLEAGPLAATTSNIVYLCRPLIKYVKIIADQIKRHAQQSPRHTYTLLLVPRVSALVKSVLEEEGVLGDVTLIPYNLQFIPVDEDVVSLEHDAAFKEIWADGDETVIFDSAQALLTFQKLYGLFPRVVGKGDKAARLATLLSNALHQARSDSPPDTLLDRSDKIDALIILDRQVDPITPLLTQLTYQGLIDELIGIKNSHVDLPASLVSPPTNDQTTSPSTSTTQTPQPSMRKEAKKKYHLSSTDHLFAELRDRNFSTVLKRMNKIARRLDEEVKASRQARSIPQLKDVVGRLGSLQAERQSLVLHIGLAEMLVPITNTEHFSKALEIQQNLLASYRTSDQLVAIEDLIAQGADFETVLRLVCLASVTTGGIKPKTLDGLKREILQNYGYHLLPSLLALSSPSLSAIVPNPAPVSAAQPVKYPFVALRDTLRLWIDDSGESHDEAETDLSYVYSGYAPISIRLVQCLTQRDALLKRSSEKGKAAEAMQPDGEPDKLQAHPIVGWKGFEDVIASIPGEAVDIIQAPARGSQLSNSVRFGEKESITVVFFLGGCTYTEIAALRWVARQNKGRKFIIATTSIIRGSSLIDEIAGVNKSIGSKDAGI
ncbi:Sec1-like protein [Cylindrobasidium torrendii FP15055 ss-10]|uniref:Sec1-like protein n=1 Tax=Cylindrobasidium torrendii FP15055 ss-10 TaxID=1314674 RepID=A0A0D7BTL0_9AGAR|nr:Sec1-like protein [Cylindrobasidium torrendii FP15055 ss-10]